MTVVDGRYGHGRKHIESQRIDAHIADLRRRLYGYVLEDDKGNLLDYRYPEVESAAWADELEQAARAGVIPYSVGWKKVKREAQIRGVYPPPAQVVFKEGSKPEVRGKTACVECGVPTSPIYQNAYGVCYDCQLAEQPGIGGSGSPVVYQEKQRSARRMRQEEAHQNDDLFKKLQRTLRLLGLTRDQYEVALMYVQGYQPIQIADMTNRSEWRIGLMLKAIRKRSVKRGFKPLIRMEDTSGASRHVRSVPPERFSNL